MEEIIECLANHTCMTEKFTEPFKEFFLNYWFRGFSLFTIIFLLFYMNYMERNSEILKNELSLTDEMAYEHEEKLYEHAIKIYELEEKLNDMKEAIRQLQEITFAASNSSDNETSSNSSDSSESEEDIEPEDIDPEDSSYVPSSESEQELTNL